MFVKIPRTWIGRSFNDGLEFFRCKQESMLCFHYGDHFHNNMQGGAYGRVSYTLNEWHQHNNGSSLLSSLSGYIYIYIYISITVA